MGAQELTEKENFEMIKIMQSRDILGSSLSSGELWVLIWTEALTPSPTELI